jgi:hypothetical protein
LSCGTELDSVGVCSFWFFAIIAQAVELGVANARIRAHVPVAAPIFKSMSRASLRRTNSKSVTLLGAAPRRRAIYGPMAKLQDAPHLGCGSFGSVGGNPTRATIFASTRSVLTRFCTPRSPERSWMEAPINAGRMSIPLSLISSVPSARLRLLQPFRGVRSVKS